jgi:hypothetical protein
MKIGDILREVAKKEKVKENRRKLKAFYRLAKNQPKKYKIELFPLIYNNVKKDGLGINLKRYALCYSGGDCSMGWITEDTVILEAKSLLN